MSSTHNLPSKIDNKPAVNGLVLAGGKSTRMGEDKGEISYHGLPQREYAAQLLNRHCAQTFISSSKKIESSFEVIPDIKSDLGPFGGIVSAFKHDPNAAWLVVAVDMPLLSEATIRQLISERNPSKVATCFYNPETQLPEPLLTLWEPKAYPILLQSLDKNDFCVRKLLVNDDVAALQASNSDVLLNANTPEEKQDLLTKIHG